MAIRVLFGIALIVSVAASAQAADIHNAVNANDLSRVKRVIEKDAKQVDAQQQNSGYTPMHFAVMNNRIEIVNYLLSKEADVNLQDRYKRTVLWWAVNHRRTELIRLLLEHKANPNIKDQWQNSPLLQSLSNQKDDHAEMLLNAGADPNITYYKRTAFHMACNYNRTKVVVLMLEKGAKVDALDGNKATALFSAAERGHRASAAEEEGRRQSQEQLQLHALAPCDECQLRKRCRAIARRRCEDQRARQWRAHTAIRRLPVGAKRAREVAAGTRCGHRDHKCREGHAAAHCLPQRARGGRAKTDSCRCDSESQK